MSLSTTLAQRTSKPFSYITIDGIGDNNGQFRFSSRSPTNPSGNATYKPWLTSEPLIDQVEANPLGGIASRGQLQFSILDKQEYRNDPGAITRMFGVESSPVASLSQSVSSSSQTTFYCHSVTNLSSGSFYWIGMETVKVSSVLTGNNSVVVERGKLGTTAFKHSSLSGLFSKNPRIAGRKAALNLAFDKLNPDEDQIDEWYIEECEQSPDLMSYVFKARTQHKWFDRNIASGEILEGDLRNLIAGMGDFNQHNSTKPRTMAAWTNSDTLLFPRSSSRPIGYLKNEKSVVEVAFIGGSAVQAIEFHNDATGASVFAAESKVESWQIGSIVRECLVADADLLAASFRYQAPSNETSSRSTGTWIKTDHPVDVLLIMLLSSHRTEDDLELVNYTAGQGNFSSLPPGWGIGVPASKIDFDSFAEVKRRLGRVRVQNLVIHEKLTFRKWAEQEILKPFGLILNIVNGLITLIKPVVPWETTSGTAVGEDDILITEEKKLDIQSSLLIAEQASSVQITAETIGGTKKERTFNDIEFPELQSSNGSYEYDNRQIPIVANAVRDLRMLMPRAHALLFIARRPLWRITFRTDLSFYETSVGDVFRLTQRLLPNLGTSRDWSGVPCQIINKKLSLRDGTIAWTVIAYGKGLNVCSISPSARITGLLGVTGSEYRIGIAANAYTDALTATGGGWLKNTDGQSFTVGDYLYITDPSGANFGTARGEVTAVGTGSINIVSSSTFITNLRLGYILEYADALDLAGSFPAETAANPFQRDNFGYIADQGTLTLGNTTGSAKIFGDT